MIETGKKRTRECPLSPSAPTPHRTRRVTSHKNVGVRDWAERSTVPVRDLAPTIPSHHCILSFELAHGPSVTFHAKTYRSEGKQFQDSLSREHEGKYCVEHVKNIPIHLRLAIELITKQKQKKILSTVHLFARKKCHERLLLHFNLANIEKLCRVYLNMAMAFSNISQLILNSN